MPIPKQLVIQKEITNPHTNLESSGDMAKSSGEKDEVSDGGIALFLLGVDDGLIWKYVCATNF